MATNIGFCSFSVEENLNIQYLTSVTPKNESLEFPKGDTMMHIYRLRGDRRSMQTSITGIVQTRHLDFGRSTTGYQAYLKAFEKLTVKEVDTLISNFPSLQAIIDRQKLNDPDYLQDVVLTHGDELGMELMSNEDFSSKQLAAYVLVVQAFSSQSKLGDWITPLSVEFRTEVDITADDLHSALGPKFDQALNVVFTNIYSEELKNEIKSTLEQTAQFKFMLSNN